MWGVFPRPGTTPPTTACYPPEEWPTVPLGFPECRPRLGSSQVFTSSPGPGLARGRVRRGMLEGCGFLPRGCSEPVMLHTDRMMGQRQGRARCGQSWEC